MRVSSDLVWPSLTYFEVIQLNCYNNVRLKWMKVDQKCWHGHLVGPTISIAIVEGLRRDFGCLSCHASVV